MHPASLIGQVLDQKYRIESQLGQGGMGAVYVATHLGTKRPVALKVIIPQYMAYSEFVERFRREAEAAGRLCHPNVVNVTDFGFADFGKDRITYLVMEYLQGCTLGEVLREESKLRLEFVINIVEQICAAVEEAHSQGIIHRDLKPDNIWLEPDIQGNYTVKILDFGLAKLEDEIAPINSLKDNSLYNIVIPNNTNNSLATVAQRGNTLSQLQESKTSIQPLVDKSSSSNVANLPVSDNDEVATHIQLSNPESNSEQTQKNNLHLTKKQSSEQLTRIGSILGTPIYMSPEQCRGEQLDGRSDIYSLGVMVYEMLVGETPFKGNLDLLINQHLTVLPDSLRKKRPDVPKAVDKLVMSALAKTPSERPANAAAFARALRSASEGTFALFRQAFGFYSEYFPQIFRLSVASYLIVIILAILLSISAANSEGSVSLQLNQEGFSKRNISSNIQLVAIFVTAIFYGFGHLVAAIISQLVFVEKLTQLKFFPLRSIQINIRKTIKKYLRPVLRTVIPLIIITSLGYILLIIPGIIINIYCLLVFPVLVIEKRQGFAALKRSKELISRVPATAFLTFLLMFAVPFLVATVIEAPAMELKLIKVKSLALDALVNSIASLLELLPIILINPLVYIMTILIYFKALHLGGETLTESSLQAIEEDAPPAKWQKLVQERFRIRNRSTISNKPKSL
ncbi:MAG: serine/threonine protein kinase [Blastocatellia bacterium]|nr:serine/threonine protein kinase [Blastocatellia bacterium]